MSGRIPPFSALARRPITTGLGLAALVTTLLWESGYAIDALTMTPAALGLEPWRLLTSTLPHIGPVHLIFNVYWLLILGGAVEERCGARVTGGLIVLTAVASAALEHALFSGGVGLSGVGYGLFGFCWVAARRHVAFEDVMDAATARTFVVWFVFCCAMTWMGRWEVANAAHAGGWALGMLAGLAWSIPARRRLALGATAAATVLCVALATPPVRALVNVRGLGRDLADEAYALLDADPGRALALYDDALARDGEVANWVYNRGVALHRLGRVDEADVASARALELDGSVPAHREAVAATHARRANAALAVGSSDEAARELRLALALVPHHDLADEWRAALADLEGSERDGGPVEASSLDDDVPF